MVRTKYRTRNAMLSVILANAFIGLGLMGDPSSLVHGQEQDDKAKSHLSIKRITPFRTLLGNEETPLDWRVTLGSTDRGRLLWKVAIEHRTLLRGEAPLDGSTSETADIRAKIRTPEVKPGSAQAVTLSASIVLDGKSEPSANWEQTLWILPQDPFADRRDWLNKLKIVVYDPAGKTAECFEAAKIPFEPLANINALESVETGLIVVGEGISLRDDRGLSELLWRRAASGVPVLCLAPTQGELELRVSGEPEGAAVNQLSLRRSDVIRDIDKRLDDQYWMSQKVAANHSLRLAGAGSNVVAEVVEGTADWTWLELRFPKSTKQGERTTNLVVVCLPIVERWEDGPTPRHLLARLFEYLASDHSDPGD